MSARAAKRPKSHKGGSTASASVAPLDIDGDGDGGPGGSAGSVSGAGDSHLQLVGSMFANAMPVPAPTSAGGTVTAWPQLGRGGLHAGSSVEDGSDIEALAGADFDNDSADGGTTRTAAFVCGLGCDPAKYHLMLIPLLGAVVTVSFADYLEGYPLTGQPASDTGGSYKLRHGGLAQLSTSQGPGGSSQQSPQGSGSASSGSCVRRAVSAVSVAALKLTGRYRPPTSPASADGVDRNGVVSPGAAQAQLPGGGATLIAVVLQDGRVIVANVQVGVSNCLPASWLNGWQCVLHVGPGVGSPLITGMPLRRTVCE